MKQLIQDKRLLVVIGVVVVLLIVGLYFFLNGNKEATQSSDVTPDISTVQTLSAQDVGLDVQPHVGNKCSTSPTPYNEVRFVLNKADDIKHVAWQFTYDADVPPSDEVEGGNGQVTQELESDADNTTGNQFTSHYEFLGTCSKNVCRCDTGVKKVHLVLKINKNDGKTYKVEADKEFSPSASSSDE